MNCKIETYIDIDGQELTKKTLGTGDIVYRNKKCLEHRLGGPAFIRLNNYQAWYKDGKLHRLDGPAVVWSDGKEFYYLDGKEVTKKEVDLLWIKKQVEK